MSDTFESLWAECSEPSDRDDDERRLLADLFWRSGVAAERERISGYIAAALRDFARRLESKP